jgi:hypothetical protein
MLMEIEDFLEGFNQPTYRGMRVNGSGSLRGPQGGAKRGEVAKILRASVRPGRTPRVSSGQPGPE